MSDTTERECNICAEVYGPDTSDLDVLLINGVWTCRNCLNDVFRRVISHDDEYPALMNGELIDLGEFSAYVDHELLESYHQLAPELSAYPHQRVYCAAGHFIGKTVAANPINPFRAVGECPICKKTACKACKKPLSKEYPIASALSHGCKEKIAAAEKEHQKLLDGEDRGKHYQVCPICRRYVNLHSACYHISCQCKGHLCYKCGAIAKDTRHWGPAVSQCELYPDKLSHIQQAARVMREAREAAARAGQGDQQAAAAGNVGAQPVPQPQHMIETVLHGLQPAGRNYVLTDAELLQQAMAMAQPERDMEWEREEAEMAHDDALRDAERLADLDL
jgi:hypothetical protein